LQGQGKRICLAATYKSIPNNERIGLYQEWYDNGQLSKSGIYLSTFQRDKNWLEYYQDGSQKLKAEFRDGTFLIHDFWTEQGEHLLTDGTGLYINEYSYLEDVINREEQEYKNYKRDGKQHSYQNGLLTSYQEMKDGKEHGISRNYYKNGNVQWETVYQNGESVSSQVFPKSENPVGKVTFKYLMNDQWLLDQNLPTADTYPVCLNEREIALNIKMPKAFADPNNHNLEGSTCLWLTIDKAGRVRKVDFKSAYMTNGQEFMAVADKMKFRPAMKDGVEVASFIYVIANFNVE
jgi:antitoxin component YwqK of YwqJK toxin-antitoxin module